MTGATLLRIWAAWESGLDLAFASAAGVACDAPGGAFANLAPSQIYACSASYVAISSCSTKIWLAGTPCAAATDRTASSIFGGPQI
jgi:hypothetical protein